MSDIFLLADFGWWGWTAVGGAALGVVAFTTVLVLRKQFKRCPSNRVLVIYGKTGRVGGAAKTIHGGAAFVVPLVQAYNYLSLEPIQIEIPLRGALSAENIRVNVPSVFTVAVDTKPEVMQNAAIRLMGLTVTEIRKQAEEIIFGQLRQVIASMNIEEINRDREQFLQHIQVSLEPELNKIGLQLINVNITDITDESGYIDAIGQKAASEAIQKARGDVADNERMGETRAAEAGRDKAIQVAEAGKEQSIGTRSAERDQAVRVASLEKEQVIGEKQAAFERESQVKQAEQQMRIQVADADAAAIAGENLAQATVAGSNAELLVKKAEAYQVGESRKRQAEAAVMEAQNLAMAKAAVAESERTEAEQRAKLEAPAKAQTARLIVDAEAAAETRRLQARAEADAIFMKLEAEAQGQYEILAKKGEGLQRIVEACGGAHDAFQLLMLEHMDNLADASSRAISNIKFDKVVVWDGGGQNGRTATADFLSGLAKTLPPMMQAMKDVGGVELPESLVKLAGAGDGTPQPETMPEADNSEAGSPPEQKETEGAETSEAAGSG